MHICALISQMNRPFGAVDVAANLKGAVPKATTQKILVALAEKGEIVQKTYGRVIGCCEVAYVDGRASAQARLHSSSSTKQASKTSHPRSCSSSRTSTRTSRNRTSSSPQISKQPLQVRGSLGFWCIRTQHPIPAAYIELAKLKATPTDAELLNQLEDTATMVRITTAISHLPLKSCMHYTSPP